SALALIGMGIYQRKKFIRIGAMVLFGGTLVKLFFYDIVHLNTISKTIVLVSLGVLLLIISFLYNKFKDEIAEKNEE
ncbi:MAG: putative membrane protein, partial [Paraglaciecola sp.]